MYPTLIYAARQGERVRHPRCHGDQIFFELRSDVTQIIRLVDGEAPQALVLPDAHPEGSLLAFDGDDLIYLTADATLMVIAFESGQRHALRTLEPVPCAIAVTPEFVVWCTAHADGNDGEVWRWWRDTDRVEQLATHDSARPLLAVRPVPLPYPPERMATDVAIAADRQLGLIDIEGVDWIATADDSILHLACTTEMIVGATQTWVVYCDLDSEQCERVFALEGPPRALVASGDRTIVAHDCVLTADFDGQIVCTPPANVYELRGDAVRCAGPLDDPTWVRGTMFLACGPRGAILVEDGRDLDGNPALENIDRVSYLPYDWKPCDWYQTLHISRWLPDGRGVNLMIEHDDWWCGTSSGQLGATIFRRVNEWLASAPPIEQPIPPTWRGWRVSMGDANWYCEDDDLTSQQALYIARLVTLLTPHVPPLAMVARLRGPARGHALTSER